MEGTGDLLRLALGLESKEINVAQMALCPVVVYVVTVVVVRLGKQRLMGQGTAFDVIPGIVLGSAVSRAITGMAPLVPAVLVAQHWLFSAVALRWHAFGTTFKGYERLLVRMAQATGRPCARCT